MTYALRETRSLAVDALAAPIARAIARMALAALGLSADPFHEPFHDRGPRAGRGPSARHGVVVTPALQLLFSSRISAKAALAVGVEPLKPAFGNRDRLGSRSVRAGGVYARTVQSDLSTSVQVAALPSPWRWER